MRHEEMLIGGRWRGAANGRTFDIDDPATSQIVASAPLADAADIDEAVASAVEGFHAWRAIDGWERSRRLRAAGQRIRDDRQTIADLLTEEQGKPLAQALAEVDSCVEQFEWYADEARRIYGRIVPGTTSGVSIEVRREPVGPVAAFTPWNFPIMLAARKLAPALAAGCSVVLKPAEEAPSACLRMIRAIAPEFPAGAINAVTGDPAAISERLVRAREIRKISLTGSTRVGTLLLTLAAETVKDVSMELGGHGPVIVWSDVDVARVARAAAHAKYRNAGQVCISPTRFFVHADVVDEFIEVFAAAAAEVVVGDGRIPATVMGPLASARRLTEVESLIRDAVDDHGATLVTGGTRLFGLGPGHYFAPTVLAHVPDSAPISSVEPFGPVALINSVHSIEEALERANSTEYGLAAYAFTKDLARARQIADGLEAGMVGLNSYAVSTAVAPFSGVKSSGIGAENGIEAMEAYLTSKTVVIGLDD